MSEGKRILATAQEMYDMLNEAWWVLNKEAKDNKELIDLKIKITSVLCNADGISQKKRGLIHE